MVSCGQEADDDRSKLKMAWMAGRASSWVGVVKFFSSRILTVGRGSWSSADKHPVAFDVEFASTQPIARHRSPALVRPC